MNLLKALSNETRRKMLGILARKEMHITGLANEIGISVPVAAKHVDVLEKAGLVERKKFGRSHVIRANLSKQYQALDMFAESVHVEVPKGTSVLDALRKVSGIKLRKVGDREFLASIEGEEGFYIYEVDGKTPDIGMDKFELNKDSKVEIKKLVPVKRKELIVRIKQ
ncbi:MAG: ArsR/SmtB family transcription factor [Candidatus Hydrothermarchaeota archaeon]